MLRIAWKHRTTEEDRMSDTATSVEKHGGERVVDQAEGEQMQLLFLG